MSYKLKIQLSVLDELGVNLYSNTPAVLSELVANSWDADAQQVSITFDLDKGIIVIEDDGCGMNADDLQNKFLNVGYRKRAVNGISNETEIFERPYMGRKGIGKLSMFAVADTAEIHSAVVENEVEQFRGGIKLQFSDIQEKAKHEIDYNPEVIGEDKIKGLTKGGTRIILSSLKKNVNGVAKYLATRIARRFSIIGETNNFKVTIGGRDVTPEDRQYFHKLQEVWWFGEEGKSKYESYCKNLGDSSSDTDKSKCSFTQDPLVIEDATAGSFTLSGWIGAVKHTKQIIDNDDQSLNKIILLVRGKLAHEDLLPLMGDDRIWRQYLIGEITADFLDDSDEDDIALASRQGIKEGDARFSAVIKRLETEVKKVISKIAKIRKDNEDKKVMSLPSVNEWMKTIPEESQTYAKQILSKVIRAGDVTDEERKTLVKHSIIAFEYLSHQKKLHEVENVGDDEIDKLVQIFGDINRLEATMYGEIAIGRITAIKKLRDLIKKNALEKDFQILISENLWLLDSSWERATVLGEPHVEESIKTAWSEGKNIADIENGRIDISYNVVGGDDVIIELKRSSRKVDTPEILKQARKYIRAYKKAKRTIRAESTPSNPSTIILLGEDPSDWSDSDEREDWENSLKEHGIRVRTYDELLERARVAYEEYLKKEERTNSLRKLISSIDSSD